LAATALSRSSALPFAFGAGDGALTVGAGCGVGVVAFLARAIFFLAALAADRMP